MTDFLSQLFSPSPFIPHGHCYLWQTNLVSLHVLSDALIALAYYSIPITLFYLVRKRQDLPFEWVFLLFAAFIVACGTTHVLEIWTLWYPTYWVSGLVKASTALVSVVTATQLFPLMPKILALPSPAQLEHANLALQSQITERLRIEEELKQYQNQLESLVAERTNELTQANQTLQQEITDRKQAEEALRQSEDRFRMAIESARLGTWDWNLVTNELRWDVSCKAMFGLPPEAESQIEVFYAGLHPQDRDRLEQGMQQYLNSSSDDNYEVEYRTIGIQDGIERWIMAKGQVYFDAASNPHRFIGTVMDISDRKQAEIALRESEERFRTLADNISQFAWMTDASGWIFWYNQRWFDYTGTTLEDMQGWGWQQVHHPEHIDRVVEHFRRSIETGEKWEDTFPIRGRDGLYRWFLSRALPIRDEAGQIVHWFGTNTDITDRKQAEDALRESESRFRYLVELIPQLVWTADTKGTLLDVNQRWSTFTGLTLSQAQLEGWEAVVHPDDVSTLGEQWAVAQQAGTSYQAEGRMRGVNGIYRWYLHQAVPMKDEQGQVIKWFGTATDISERKLADERLHLLYDTTSDLLAADRPLALMHNLFHKLSIQLELDYYYNYIVEEKDHRPMLHLKNYGGISDTDAQAIEWIEFGQHLCGLVAQERQQIVFDYTQLSSHPNAQMMCAVGITAYAGQPLIVQGRLLGTLSFASRTRTSFTPGEMDLLQSVSDQMAIALERMNLMSSIQQQAEKLQRANQIKDEFLAVLSHELRSPLNPILGWTRLLQSGRLDATHQAEGLATIERNAKLQAQLIEDLLDISRIMQGKLSLTAAPVSLTFVVSAAVETVRLAIEAKHIQLILDLDSTIAPISGDGTRLQQVLWNLLSNAVKFTPNGGQVTVELRQVDRLAQIRVMDTGIGINSQFLPYVFDYFRQADGSTTRKFGGLGLGLAIVRQIVEMHGGTVRAESQGEGLGATFTVQLPTMQQSLPIVLEPTRTQTDLEKPLDNLHILVVDDDTDTREFQAFLLEQNGAKVTAVTCGLEALQALEQFVPDIIVSDVGMADMDGYMLMQQIRSREALPSDSHSLSPGGRIPAIALTAYAAEVDQQKALQAGFQAHLTKPVEPETLVRAIVNLISHN